MSSYIPPEAVALLWESLETSMTRLCTEFKSHFTPEVVSSIVDDIYARASAEVPLTPSQEDPEPVASVSRRRPVDVVDATAGSLSSPQRKSKVRVPPRDYLHKKALTLNSSASRETSPVPDQPVRSDAPPRVLPPVASTSTSSTPKPAGKKVPPAPPKRPPVQQTPQPARRQPPRQRGPRPRNRQPPVPPNNATNLMIGLGWDDDEEEEDEDTRVRTYYEQNKPKFFKESDLQ